MALTAKQERFVEEYLVDLNATQAAIRAGYSKKTAYSMGQRLLKNVEVSKAIAKATVARTKRVEVDQDYVIASVVTTMERCKTDKEFSPAAVMRGAELLGKHLGMFTDKLDLTSSDGTMTPTAITRTIVDPQQDGES